MEISFAKGTDKAAVRSMWQYCFGDSESYMDAYFSHVYKDENTIVARDGEAAIASLQIRPHFFSLNGKLIRGMYIGGVSVMPSYRGQGIATKLMVYAENRMRENQIDVSFLVPFRFAFYKKMGYECVSFLSEFSGAIAELKPFSLTDCPLYPLSAPPVKAYANFAKQFSLFLKRDLYSYTDEIFRLCGDAYCYALDDDAGYILYTLSNGEFHALECVYNDEIALRRILGFIYSHRAELKTFRIRTAASSEIRKLLCENTITEIRYPHAMAKKISSVDFSDSMQNYINMLGWF